MTQQVSTQRIKHRRDTGANWTAVNPILLDGELGIETDAPSLRGKYGDGVTEWNDLPYTELGQRPIFQGLTITGTDAVVIPHIHGTIAGDFYVHVRNTSGGVLPAGTAVYVTGSVGDTDRLRVEACDPGNPAKMPAVGLLKYALANNGNGDAVILGELRPFNTAGLHIGAQLYVGAGGSLTAVTPTGIVQAVGTVARVNVNTGTIAVAMGPLLGTAALQAVDMFATPEQALPTGGNTGNILIKSSPANYAADWAPTLDGGTFN